jgi:SAM-dependent methyltransferase
MSLVGHAGMPMCSPLTLEELDPLLRAVPLRPGDRTIDLGGGRGDLAIHCAKHFGCEATTVDLSEEMTREARERARGVAGVVVERGAAAEVRAYGCALASCLGATFALGGFAQALTPLFSCVRAGGAILVGDLVALGDEAAAALEIARLDEMREHPHERELVLGPERLAAYEEAWTAAVRAHLAQHPTGPDADWARFRIEWMASEGMARVRRELAFAVFLMRAR